MLDRWQCQLGFETMVDPVRVQGQRAIRLEVSEDQASHPDDIKAMFDVARQEFGPQASLKNFEFRLKESGGHRYLELREQTWFGRFREKIESRRHDRLVERHEALDVLRDSFGVGLLHSLNLLDGASPNHVQARSIVQYLKEDLVQPSVLARFEAEGFETYESAAQFVDNKINFVKTTSKADLVRLNDLNAHALANAVFADPSILDPNLSQEERVALFEPHEEAFFQRKIVDIQSTPKSDIDTVGEHRFNIDAQLKSAFMLRQNAKNADLENLASADNRDLMMRTLVKGKDAGLRLKDVTVLGGGQTYEAFRDFEDYRLKEQLEHAYNLEILPQNDVKSLERFFNLPSL